MRKNITSGYIAGMCHGCFDLLHAGHVDFLREARELCDKLIVSVTSDQHVNKGPGRPVINEADRMKMLNALSSVDEVILSDGLSGYHNIKKIKPTLFFLGSDYTLDSMGKDERLAAKEVGAHIVFIQTPKQSTTEIIQRCKLA